MGRIQYHTRPRSQSFDAAIVIPSFREGFGVLQNLETIADQEHVNLSRIAVAVVVNNARNASAEVLRSNRQTDDIIRGLWTQQPPPSLLQEADQNEKAYEALLTFRKICRADLRPILIDAWRGSNAPRQCNVGLARDWGCRSVWPLLKPFAPIVNTDADTKLVPRYMRTALDLYAETDTNAAKGPAKNVYDDRTKHIVQSVLQYRGHIFKVQNQLLSLQGIPPVQESPIVLLMGGANLTLDKETYRDTGGFPHIPGGEDTHLSLKILRSGRHITYDEGLEVHTEARPSDRTHEDNGFGQMIIRLLGHVADFGQLPLQSMQWQEERRWLFDHLDGHVRSCHDAQSWVELCREFDFKSDADPLTVEESVALWNAYCLAPNLYPLADNHVFQTMLNTMLQKRFPNASLKQNIETIEAVMDDATPVHKRMRQLLTHALENVPLLNDEDCPRPGTPIQQMSGMWARRVAGSDSLLYAYILSEELQKILDEYNALIVDFPPGEQEILRELLLIFEYKAIDCIACMQSSDWLRTNLSTYYVRDP
jgi:hypothetical protein